MKTRIMTMMTTATMTMGNWFRTLKGRHRCPKDKASYRRLPLNIRDIQHLNNSICKLLFGALFHLTLNTVSYSTLSDSHEEKIRLHVLPEAVKVDRIVNKPSTDFTFYAFPVIENRNRKKTTTFLSIFLNHFSELFYST